VIIEQGSAGQSMFGLTEGLLEVLVEHPEKDELINVAQLDPGAFFGEMSLLVGEPRSATVRAVTESVVYEIRRDTIIELLEARPEIGEALSEVIARRNIDRTLKIEDTTRAEREAAIAASSRTMFARMKSIFGSVLGRGENRARSA
jgi:CRP-like cAMP-binding protein